MGRTLLARWHVSTATAPEAGTSLIEYALLGIFIAVLVAIAVQALGTNTNGVFEEYTQKLNDEAARNGRR